MDDLELDDYMDDNLGEDTLATDALWAQAFDPARTSSSAPVLPQVATSSTQPQQASPQPPPRETPRPGPAHQCNPRPRRNAPAPSWLRNFETGEQAEMGEAELAEVGTGNYGSDDYGIGGGVDDLATNGAFAAVSVSRRKRENAAKLIPEEDCRQAYLDVVELKKKDKAADQSDPALHNAEDIDDEEDHGTAQGGWKSEGLKENYSKDAYERRNKHKGGDSFGLAEETKRVLPGLDRAGLDVLRNAVKGKSCAFPAMFFDLCFLKKVVDFLAQKVTEYVGFCTTPSDRRQARHEAKTTTKGHCEVPKIIVDGTEVPRVWSDARLWRDGYPRYHGHHAEKTDDGSLGCISTRQLPFGPELHAA
eukprot:jgi/Undpi1/12081/HiC_scaffold_4.g01779.m1